MTYYVTLQRYWHDSEGRTCIEIGAGEPSPGMLASGPYLETEYYWEAARYAIENADGRPITAGNSLVYGDPDDPLDPAELLEYARAAEEKAPKCERCGAADDVTEWSDQWGETVLACGQYCADELLLQWEEDEDETT